MSLDVPLKTVPSPDRLLQNGGHNQKIKKTFLNTVLNTEFRWVPTDLPKPRKDLRVPVLGERRERVKDLRVSGKEVKVSVFST